ncbi:hypothetical protein DQ04_01611030 [Trypanosoma grayi]|uniref:hypothetical protein n=1 Tax=Trypanosoma grayi TaxID=71804 RepID=UPI0004F3F003|nr:hypothetical protein DQ04_01611030 [Trypanosoma grayi]KEG12561.1 hypothetical protein DQ04_01611030 [Trypanosoma grayi]
MSINVNDADSMWLQKSIHMTDPIPDASEQLEVKSEERTDTNVERQPLEGSTARTGMETEIELTKMPFSASTVRLMQCPSQRLSCRLSVSNSAFASLQEIDELRARVNQMTRERLKWSNSQRDLEITRFELTQVREELQTMRDYVKVMKGELDEANARADREAKGRHVLETQLNDMIAQRKSENEFLKKQLSDIKEEHNQRLAEMAERSETEGTSRTEAMRDQIIKLSEELESLEASNAQAEQECLRLQTEKEGFRSSLNALQEKYEESQRSLELHANRCADLEKMHAEFVERIEKSHAEALNSQMLLDEERMRQITASKDEIVKDLREELQTQKDKSRCLNDELSSLRHRCQLAEEEAKQLNHDHEKEIKRILDEHRLALCQQQLQTEALVREAKGGRLSMEEERSSLRRQLTKTSEELSTVTAILAQREKHMRQLENELQTAKESALKTEQEHISGSKEAEGLREALNHAEERVQRLMTQQDISVTEYTKDIQGLKDQLASTQEELLRVKSELSSSVQEKIKQETESRGIISDLRAHLEEAGCEKDVVQQLSRDKKLAEELAEEYKSKYLSTYKKAENLDIELGAVTNRCALLEKRLDEELRRSLRNASISPTPPHRDGGAKRLRSASSVNIPLSTATKHAVKKSRSVEPLVFTISGFEGSALLTEIKQMPYATVAECRSNTPVPSNLTHLVTNGQLTIKLLTALVRGCWILPEAYVHDSAREKQWLDESEYGFRHEELPLSQKRIGFTEGFVTSRHYNTANLIIAEGGASTESNLHMADIVLCTHSESGSLEDMRAMTWDKVVELIYPVKVG